MNKKSENVLLKTLSLLIYYTLFCREQQRNVAPTINLKGNYVTGILILREDGTIPSHLITKLF